VLSSSPLIRRKHNTAGHCCAKKAPWKMRGSVSEGVRNVRSSQPTLGIFAGCCASAAGGTVSRLRMSVTMHPMALHHMGFSSSQPHADLLLSIEAERCASAAPGSGSDVGADAGGRRLQAVVRLGPRLHSPATTLLVLPSSPRLRTRPQKKTPRRVPLPLARRRSTSRVPPHPPTPALALAR
jgi:hypothetical protein